MVAEGGKGRERQLRCVHTRIALGLFGRGGDTSGGHTLILSRHLSLFLEPWSQGLTWLRLPQQAGPTLPVTKAPPWPCRLSSVLLASLSLPLRPGTCLFGSPARTSPSPAATVPSELETKVGGLHQPGYSSHPAVVTLDNGVAGQAWHPVLLEASGPASSSAGLRASPCSARCGHPGFSVVPRPAPWGPSHSSLPFSPEVGRPSSPLPQLSPIFLSSPL